MTNNHTRVGVGAFGRALGAALQWRLLLLWVVVMWIPTLIVGIPLANVLGGLLNHSAYASDLAHHFDGMIMGDLIMRLARHSSGLKGASQAALIATLLLSPFLTGMVVAAARASRRLGFGELVHGGVGEYWRLFRLMLWALIPFGVAVALGLVAMRVADRHAAHAVLESRADLGDHVALVVFVVLFVLAHVIVESGRGHLAASPGLRSATRALWRGTTLLARRPLATLGMYLGTSVIGYAIVWGLGMLRIRSDAVGIGGIVATWLLTQLIVIVIAWQRTARVFALASVARTRVRAGGASLAPA